MKYKLSPNSYTPDKLETSSYYLPRITPTKDIQHKKIDPRKAESVIVQPLSENFAKELKIALDYIRPPQNRKRSSTAQQKLFHSLSLRAGPIVRQETAEYAKFVEALFDSEPSQFRKAIITIKEESFDLRTADKLLQDANKILKNGIKRKTAAENDVKGDLEEFWYNHISSENTVRWDIFEEAFLLYLESYMICDNGVIRKVNWKTFFNKVYKNIADYITFYLWPKGYSVRDPPEYSKKVINKWDFFRSIQRGTFTAILRESSQETPLYISNLRKQKKYEFADGTVYVGGWRSGKREGNGELRFPSGDVYTGNFERGCREDYGVFKGQNYLYKGDWKKDLFHGYGVLIYPDKAKYEGMWVKGNMTNGKLIWNGHIYSGEWNNFLFEGPGKLTHPNLEVHKGYWKQGLLFGESTIVKQDGTKFKGVYTNGYLEGEGKMVTTEFSYTGSFKRSKPDGFGSIKYETGEKYIGEFEEGIPHGEGTYIENKTKYTGRFYEGKKEGKAFIEYPNGRTYEGEVKNEMFSGEGKIKYEEEHELLFYEGQLFNGVFHGKGTLKYRSGKIYEGDFENGFFEGYGTFENEYGKYTGSFLLGLCHGFGNWEKGQAFCSGLWEEGKPHGRAESGDFVAETYTGVFSNGVPVGRNKLCKEFLQHMQLFCFT